jgi:hypothetical protein
MRQAVSFVPVSLGSRLRSIGGSVDVHVDVDEGQCGGTKSCVDRLLLILGS